jgi:hypothetical protein
MRKVRSFLINACLVGVGALVGLAAAELVSALTAAQGITVQGAEVAAGDGSAGRIHVCMANLDCI